jgi:hypothetical protein
MNTDTDTYMYEPTMPCDPCNGKRLRLQNVPRLRRSGLVSPKATKFTSPTWQRGQLTYPAQTALALALPLFKYIKAADTTSHELDCH